MFEFIKKAFFNFIVPVILIVMLFNYHPLTGAAGILVYIGYIVYKKRVSVFIFMGKKSFAEGRLNMAVEWYRKAYNTGKAQPKSIGSFAYLLLRSGNMEQSEEILSKLLKTSLDKDARDYIKSNMALVLWKKGDLDGAIAMMEEVIADYKNSTAYGSLGSLLLVKGDLEKALKLNLEAYEHNDSNTAILDNLGQTYYLTEQYDKASEIYEKLMEKNPTFPEAYYNYGLLLLKLGRQDKAISNLEKALTCNFTFLSTITKEEIENKLKELKPAAEV